MLISHLETPGRGRSVGLQRARGKQRIILPLNTHGSCTYQLWGDSFSGKKTPLTCAGVPGRHQPISSIVPSLSPYCRQLRPRRECVQLFWSAGRPKQFQLQPSRNLRPLGIYYKKFSKVTAFSFPTSLIILLVGCNRNITCPVDKIVK